MKGGESHPSGPNLTHSPKSLWVQTLTSLVKSWCKRNPCFILIGSHFPQPLRIPIMFSPNSCSPLSMIIHIWPSLEIPPQLARANHMLSSCTPHVVHMLTLIHYQVRRSANPLTTLMNHIFLTLLMSIISLTATLLSLAQINKALDTIGCTPHCVWCFLPH